MSRGSGAWARRGRVVRLVLLALMVVAASACDRGSSGGAADGGDPSAASASDRSNQASLRLSSRRLYRVSLRSREEPPPLQRLHAWVVHVEDRDGRPLEGLRFTVDGGMPQHGHGFPSKPRVTRALGAGDYLIEGVQFNMSGEWTFRIGIVGPEGADSVTFEVAVGPGVDPR